jgi:hypothetical protein
VRRVFHGFVGGKSVDSRLLPGPRGVLLLITLMLNIWLSARLYYKDSPPPSPIWLDVLEWRRTPNVVFGLKIMHSLCASLLFTAALNSSAADASRGHHVTILGHSVSLDWLVTVVFVLNDVRWLVAMSVLSCVGLFLTEIAYAFCVMDVVPQVRRGGGVLSAAWGARASPPVFFPPPEGPPVAPDGHAPPLNRSA